MSVMINEVHSEFHAFDASAFAADDEAVRLITLRVAQELGRMRVAEAEQHRDAALSGSRRIED